MTILIDKNGKSFEVSESDWEKFNKTEVDRPNDYTILASNDLIKNPIYDEHSNFQNTTSSSSSDGNSGNSGSSSSSSSSSSGGCSTLNNLFYNNNFFDDMSQNCGGNADNGSSGKTTVESTNNSGANKTGTSRKKNPLNNEYNNKETHKNKNVQKDYSYQLQRTNDNDCTDDDDFHKFASNVELWPLTDTISYSNCELLIDNIWECDWADLNVPANNEQTKDESGQDNVPAAEKRLASDDEPLTTLQNPSPAKVAKTTQYSTPLKCFIENSRRP
jgi:hypothetical protein